LLKSEKIPGHSQDIYKLPLPFKKHCSFFCTHGLQHDSILAKQLRLFTY